MKQAYRKTLVEGLSVVQSQTTAAFYGISCNFNLAIHAYDGYVGMRISFEPTRNANSMISGSMYRPAVKLHEGTGGNFRIVEQVINIHPVSTDTSPRVRMNDANEGEAREISRTIFRVFESIVEHARRSVRSSFSKEYVARGIEYVDNLYGDETKRTVKSLLSSLHWRLLLSDTQAPEQVVNVIDYTMTHNFPEYYPLASDGYPEPINLRHDFNSMWGDIARIRQYAELAKLTVQSQIADMKAIALLRLVCGEDHYEHFKKLGYISVVKNGWTFDIAPHQFVQCKDPDGRRAELCIHTVGLSCNPIDEVVLAYLNIKHKFEEYLGKAIVHQRIDPAFSLAAFKKDREVV